MAPVGSSPSPKFTTHLVSVGVRHVAFHVAPGRSPAIVFIAGGGEDASAWTGVAGAIQKRTGAELIAIDRAGFGESDEDTRPVRVENEVDDIKAGLTKLGVKGPYVLVAHSYGGQVATVLANEAPARIAAAVLVDTSIPSFFTDDEIARFTASFPKEMPTTSKEERTQGALLKVYPGLLRTFHAMTWPASIPTTVIVSEHPPLASPAENQAWIDAHRAFAQAAPNRRYVLAEKSGHIIMADRPDVVIDTVTAAFEQARRSRF